MTCPHLRRAVQQPSTLDSLLVAPIDVEPSDTAAQVRIVDRPKVRTDILLTSGFMVQLQEAGVGSATCNTYTCVGGIEANACAVGDEERAANTLVTGSSKRVRVNEMWEGSVHGYDVHTSHCSLPR